MYHISPPIHPVNPYLSSNSAKLDFGAFYSPEINSTQRPMPRAGRRVLRCHRSHDNRTLLVTHLRTTPCRTQHIVCVSHMRTAKGLRRRRARAMTNGHKVYHAYHAHAFGMCCARLQCTQSHRHTHQHAFRPVDKHTS